MTDSGSTVTELRFLETVTPVTLLPPQYLGLSKYTGPISKSVHATVPLRQGDRQFRNALYIRPQVLLRRH